MSFFLHINTALEQAYVAISDGRKTIAFRESLNQKEHASFLHPAINEIMNAVDAQMNDLVAVSVVNGPGSYTGLRVGLSAAKGICFALQIPLISLSTLEWLAKPFEQAAYDYIVPMIDARRMEVFTATYDKQLIEIDPPSAVILDEQSFSKLTEKSSVIFTGNGAGKLLPLTREHAKVETSPSGALEQAEMADLLYQKKQFSDLAYAEPFYLKAFHSPSFK
jgi:tRNA threonylcarbamoyladenosine biosynthesis protein TsaB